MTAPGVERLDAVTLVVRADNPSPMTLEGTNTYVLASVGSREAIVVDPGPDLPAHRAAIEGALAAEGLRAAEVVLTHHHADHAGGAWWANAWGARLHASQPQRIAAGDVATLADGAHVRAGGLTLRVLATPGHTADHVCLVVGDGGAVLSGDHVLGRGTTVIAHPEGDMASYLDSLERLARVGAQRLYPAHGPVVHDAPAVLEEYRSHRLAREAQILEVITAAPHSPREIVTACYGDLPAALRPAAESSVRAHLVKLVREGRAIETVRGEVFRGAVAPRQV